MMRSLFQDGLKGTSKDFTSIRKKEEHFAGSIAVACRREHSRYVLMIRMLRQHSSFWPIVLYPNVLSG